MKLFPNSHCRLIAFNLASILSFIFVRLWAAITPAFPWIVLRLSLLLLFIVLILLFINIGHLVFSGKDRMIYFAAAIGCVVAMFIVTPVSVKLNQMRQRDYFLSVEIKQLDSIIDQINHARNSLTNEGRRLDDILGYKYVFGKTNTDGSILVWFYGRNGWSRAGYVYYTGNQLVVSPYDSTRFVFPESPNDHSYFRLTNCWYEF
jgi:hypothetical protein